MSATPSQDNILGAVSSSQKPPVSRARNFFFRLFLLFASLGILWAVATPLMAYPDEPSHSIRAAAVVRGQIAVEPGQSFGNGVHVQIPSYIANLEAQKCFATIVDRTADCAPAVPTNDNFDAIAVTSAGTYNPMYYWLVGLPTLFMTGAPAIYAMRFISVLASALFYAAAFMSLTRLRKPKWPVITGSIAITPMALFLSSGINPNSIEIAATMAAFCALLAVLDNSSNLRRMLPAILTVGISAAVLANTRSVSLVWLFCGVVIAFLFFRLDSLKRIFVNRYVLIGIGVAAVGVILGVVWLAMSMGAPESTGTAPEGIVNPAPNVAPYQAFVTMIDRTFDFIVQYVGVVGWLDTSVSQGVVAFWSMLFMATILLSLLARPRRLVWVVAVAFAAVAVVPALLQAVLVTSVGFFWQGRYSMPLVLIALVSSGMAWRTHNFSVRRRQQNVGRVLLFAVIIAHIVAFLYVLRRYVVGLRDISTWQTMISHPAWQPPLGWAVLGLIYAVVLVLAAQRFYVYLFPGQSLIALPSRWTQESPWTSRQLSIRGARNKSHVVVDSERSHESLE